MVQALLLSVYGFGDIPCVALSALTMVTGHGSSFLFSGLLELVITVLPSDYSCCDFSLQHYSGFCCREITHLTTSAEIKTALSGYLHKPTQVIVATK